jgi:epoxyqueuosine reductase
LTKDITRRIRDLAEAMGLDLVGFAAAQAFPEAVYLRQWLDAGHEGEMAFMRRGATERQDPRKLAAWARSLIAVAANYNTAFPLSTDPRGAGQGWISRYAWGDDYHETFAAMLRRLADQVREIGPPGTETRVCVDTAPIMDRACARQAGIGWSGKNTCTINRDMGSFLFLGEILTSLDLGASAPAADHCGTCSACLDACPTGALLAPHVLDSRRCISYLTIEFRGSVPLELRDRMGTNVFGCDICQEVCPWNRKSPRTERRDWLPRSGSVAPSLAELLEMTAEAYRVRFRHSAVKRAKYVGLLRNAAIAAGNSGCSELVPSLEKAAEKDPLVAEHAEWAIRKLKHSAMDG